MSSGLPEPAESSVPPGSDEPPAPLAAVLRPVWRAVAISVSVCILVALALLIVLPRPHAGAVTRVDQTSIVARARQLAAFPVFVPSPLPPGWVSDSYYLDAGKGRAHLHLGFQSPDFGVVGVEETSARRWRALLSQITAGGVPKDLVHINGQLWIYQESPRRVLPSLVWYGPTSEVIVAGTTTLANLTQLAESLHITG
jgi:Protein of unknown function (DUF4245)